LELTPPEITEILEQGRLDVVGRMRYSSNATFLVNVAHGGVELPAVYKPRRGERPLWDFPDGTLCRREVAAYELSKALGWGIVPVTVLRDEGPAGPGALQQFVAHDPGDHYFTLLEAQRDRFRTFAAFDVALNNTDRKAGHCLYDPVNDIVVGIDHGLAFHATWKLRTVIWDFAGEPVPPALVEDLCRVEAETRSGALRSLVELLSEPEIAAMLTRVHRLLRTGSFPEPDEGHHSLPWPMV
jgi:uncharacterized repeat protein (TIGR03843 family)